jgi:F-type H+-transporting ATPase subunit b
MPQFDFANVFAPQLAWLALFFVVLYFGAVRLTLPKLGKVMEQREDKIAGDLAAAKAAKDSADAVDERYHADMAASRDEARVAIAGAKAKAAKASDASLAKAAAKADATIAEAEARIAKAAKAAEGKLADAAAESAQAIVAKLTGVEPALAAAKQSVSAQF